MKTGKAQKLVARIVCVICFSTLLPVRANAWGAEGHRIVARIAARHLTEKTRTAVLSLLQADKEDLNQCKQLGALEDQLACVATWADEVRNPDKFPKYKNTGPFHFVNIPIYAPQAKRHYDERLYCNKGCLVTALGTYRHALVTANNDAARAVALKFIVHLVADLHQPLHDAVDKDFDLGNKENSIGNHKKLLDDGQGDRGGNRKLVTWLGAPSNQFGCWNLHAVWDEAIIEKKNPSDKDYANQLNNKLDAAKVASLQTGTVIDWVNEALAHAVAAYRDLPQPVKTDRVCEVKIDGTRECAKYGATVCRFNEVHYRYHLEQSYYEKNLPVVESQLQSAGVRLAKFLNRIFDPTGSGSGDAGTGGGGQGDAETRGHGGGGTAGVCLLLTADY
jgi:hypothetical protein